MTTLYLIRHGATGETGRGAFPSASGADPDAPGADLDAVGRVQAGALREHLPRMDAVWSSHAARTIQTAERSMRAPDERHVLLAEADFGPWAGRMIAHVHAEAAAQLEAWMADPDAVPTGAERFADVRTRGASLLTMADRHGGAVAAVTHGGLIRGVLVEVLRGPPQMAWGLGVPPASVTVVQGGAEGWQVVTMAWLPTLPAPMVASPTGGGVRAR